MLDVTDACQFAVKRAVELGATEAEGFAAGGREINVSIERNEIKIGKSQELSGIGVRVILNHSLGFASVNDLTRKEIEKAAEKAVGLARKAPPLKFNELPDVSPMSKVEGLYDPRSRDFTMDDALDNATRLLRTAKDYDKRVTMDSGYFSVDVGESAVANSSGVEVSEEASAFTHVIIGMAIEGDEVSSFDYRFNGTRRVDEIDVETSAKTLAETVVGSLGAKKIESFKGTAVLNPSTVVDLLAPVIAFSANSNTVQKGMSRFVGRLGDEVAPESLTVRDDGQIPGGLGSSGFDREGVPHQPLEIIEKGVLKNFLYNTLTAKKEERETTGHASGGISGPPRIAPTNLIIEPGEETMEGLIGETDKGVIISRFSGVPDVISGDFSGAVKGGYLIEKGEKVSPIKETLVAGNVFELFMEISGISKETERIMNFIVPWVRLENVSVTSA
ncbi:MAG: TldD/PmbA family protein [Thermoplasmata archaeon]